MVWRGRDVASDLAAVAARRLLEGEADAGRGFALQGRAFAPLADVEAFLEGSVDDARIANLARGLMALGWEGFRRGGFSWRAAEGRSGTPSELGALHALFRLVHLPEPLGDLVPRSDREVLRLLVAGRLADAAAVALRRLGASGLRPKVRLALGSPALSCRLAAALAVPVDPRDLGRLRDLVAKPLAETFARSAMEG